MADNVAITAGAGTTVATDDVGGVQYQRVKPAVGVDGTAVDVSAAAPMPSNVTDGTSVAGVTPFGAIRVTDEPTTIFYDPFDSALETANYWTTPTVGNSAVIATVTTGNVSLGTGTTASGWSKLFSQASFKLQIPGWTGYSFALAIPDLAAPTANAYRFWGSGTPQAVPTTANPLSNAVGFELATDGKMYAVVYAGGTRTVVQDLSAATGNSKQPTNASMHRYIVQIRTDKSYWYIDGVSASTLVATADFVAPQVQTLPIVFLAVGGSTPPASNAQIQCAGAAVWDTSKSNVAISDPIFDWRSARVTAAGELLTTDTYRNKIATAIAHTGKSTVTAAADGATVGRFWLINPVGSTILIEVRRVEFSSAPIAATAFVTSPRITVERVTFTGTASGAQITPAVRDTAEVALQGSLRTASTGLTLTAGAVAYGFTVVPILTAVGAAVPMLQEWEPNEAGRLVLRAGQGIVIRQADAGTVSDTRAFAINLAWAEFTVVS